MKRFDEWSEVDCNQCQHYWNDSCDSVQQGVKRPCNSFLATRKVNIPAKLDSLKIKVKRIGLTLLIELMWLVVLTITIGVVMLFER